MDKKKSNIKGKRNEENPKEVKSAEKKNKFTAGKESSKIKSKDRANCPNIQRNDPEFYLNGPAGSIPYVVPFSYATGSEPALSLNGGSYFAERDNSGGFPGIMCLDVAPVYGNMSVNGDAINTAITKMHIALRYGQSYAHTYDAAQLGMHLMMADTMYMILAISRRIYGVMNYYSAFNKYLPDGLIAGMGFNASTFNGMNHDEFRNWINIMASKIDMVKVPANWDVFKRHQFIFDNVFVDDPGAQTQFYVFRPVFLYKYVVDNTTARLETVSLGTGMSLTDWVSTAEDIVNSYIYNEDLAIISADFLRYYGAEGVWKARMIDPDYQVMFIQDNYVANQVHNATVCNVNWSSQPAVTQQKWYITQNPETGALIQTPTLTMATNNRITLALVGPITMDKYLDIMDADLSPAMVAEATRLMVFGDIRDSTVANSIDVVLLANTEVVLGVRMMYVYNGSNTWTPAETYTAQDIRFSKFKSAPLAYVTSASTATGDVPAIITYSGVIGDITNWSVINRRMFEVMQVNSDYSLFRVPSLDYVKPIYGSQGNKT